MKTGRARGFSKLWWVVIAAIVGCAVVATYLLVKSEPERHRIAVQAVWPTSLSATEPTLATGIVVSSAGGTGGSVTLYAAPPILVDEGKFSYPPSRLEDAKTVEVAQAEIDEHGFFEMTIPAASAWSGVDQNDLRRRSVSLLLHLRVGDAESYRQLHLPIDKSTEVVSALALTLDRPLYQPGQTILMRSVVVNRTKGSPLDKSEVHWQVHDPQGNLVFDERNETTRAGVAASRFELAEQGTQGDYRVSARSGSASAEQVVSVRPFRLPRFTLALQPEEPSVESSGELSWQVDARYTHGEAVAGAAVTTEISWRTWDKEESLTLEGLTDDRGHVRQSWTAPVDLRPGTSVRLATRVMTEAGRAEGASSSIRVASEVPVVQIYPIGRAHFVTDHPNEAIAVVTNWRGEPLVKEALTIFAPEAAGQRTIELVTDTKGRARFEWQPKTGPLQARLKQHPMSMQNLEVSLRERPYRLRSLSPAARAGEPYDFVVEASDKPSRLVVMVDGTLLVQDVLPASPTSYTHSVVLPDAARGLTVLQVIDSQGLVDELPVWIRQPGGSQVLVETRSETYEPGEKGTVELAFPILDVTDEPIPVTFGLVGVDEALYALKERADVPLEVLLHQAPHTIAALLPVLEDLVEEDDTGRQILASRFLKDLDPQVGEPAMLNQGRDVTWRFARQVIQERALHLSIFLSLLLYILLALMVSLTWRTTSKSVFTLSNFGLIAAVAIAATIAGFVLIFFLEEVGLAVMALGLVLVGILVFIASSQTRARPAFLWLVAVVAAVLVAMCVVINLETANHDLDLAVIFVFLIPLAVLVVTGTVWAFILVGGKHRMAGLALSAAVGPLAFAVVAATLFGETVGHKFESAQEMTSGVSFAPSDDSSARSHGSADEKGGAPVGDKAGAGPEGTVRSWFPETMVWMPEIPSDARGKAEFSFAIPDSITTWRLDAWAHSRDGRFGQGQTGLRVTRPVFMELELPTHLTDGDRIDVPATLVNGSDSPLVARIEAEASGALQVEGNASLEVRLEARSRRLVHFSVRARGVGAGSLTVSAFGEPRGDQPGVLLDGERRAATVAPHGRTVHDTVSGPVNEGWMHAFDIPQDAIANTSAVDVVVYPSSVADALEGLEGMLRMPSGCFEQTSSINYPNTMVMQTLEQTPPADWPGGEVAWTKAMTDARQLIHLGYQRMLTFQDSGGGFALYPNRQPEVMLTAYGIMQLREMSRVYAIDERVMERAASWLTARINDDGSWTNDRARYAEDATQDGKIRATAFVTLGLLYANPDRNAPATELGLSFLEKNVAAITSDYTLALVAYVLVEARRDTAPAVLKDLAGRAVSKDDRLHWNETSHTWMGGRGQYALLETTAVAANAYLQAGSNRPMWNPMLRYISEGRASWGGWGSTQATVWALKALQGLRGPAGMTELQIQVNGKAMPPAQGDAPPGQLIIDSDIDLARAFREGHLSPGPARVHIQASQTTPAMFRATAEYAVPWRVAARGSDVNVSLLVADRQMSLRSMQRVTARLQNTTSQRQATLIVELPIAPAAFVPADQFEAMVADKRIDSFEILPTHVRLYLDKLEPGQELLIDYSFAPMIRGEVVLPPLRAYAFYTPRPIYETDGGVLRMR